MVAALYVARGGCYFGLPDVDPYDISRDARLYAGPWPVVAHPPCERWGKYWFGSTSPHAPQRFAKGDDGGCFAAALEAVRRYGGVLEHPAKSHAWRAFGLIEPPGRGGWVIAERTGYHHAAAPAGLDLSHRPVGLRAPSAEAHLALRRWLRLAVIALEACSRPRSGWSQASRRIGAPEPHRARSHAPGLPRPALEHGPLRFTAEVRVMAGYLFLALLVAIVASILMRERRPRPKKPRLEVLSDSAARVAFRDSHLEEQRRRNG